MLILYSFQLLQIKRKSIVHVTSQKCILFTIQRIQQKESNLQNKVYTLPHTPASAFISAHVHSTIIAVYKTKRKARVS